MTSIALVTGTSSGMGLHAAVELATRGHHVVATMRDLSRAGRLRETAAAAGVTVELRALDVTDPSSRDACVAAVLADHGQIDVLVNNAGQGCVGTAEQLSLETIQEQLDVNYLGPVALTKLVLPGMRERGSGRIITVTSVGGAVGQPFAEAYCGAKFAVEGFMQSLAVTAGHFGVEVSVVQPAAVASDFVQNVERVLPDPTDPYSPLLQAYVSRTEAVFAAAQTEQSAGLAIADAATSEEYRFRWQTSEAAATFSGVSLADLDGSRVLGATRGWIV